ncbi:MAG: Jag N-terminal domain-containing protein [bacterium]|nr:Jag N-terminal domain-containing protein [bacterium]
MDKERNYLEVDGDSVEDAIKRGMDLLKTNAENVDIEILNEPVNGFLKFGRKKARVRLTLLRGTVPPSLLKSPEKTEETPHKKHDRISVQEVLETKSRESQSEPKKRDDKVNAFRQYREQRQQSQREIPQQKKSAESSSHRDNQIRKQENKPVQHHPHPQAPQPRLSDVQEIEPPYEPTEEDKMNIEKISKIFMKLTDLMGFNVEPEISVLSNKYRIIIKDTPDASLLIGKNGKTIEALQHIVNKISLKESVNKPVYLDIKGYVKQKRKNKFEKRWKR